MSKEEETMAYLSITDKSVENYFKTSCEIRLYKAMLVLVFC